MKFLFFRFALGGAASRVLKIEFNSEHLNKILGYIFESLRSLDWIEDVAATENRKLEWVDEEEIVAERRKEHRQQSRRIA